jgi:hypothetical protein
MRRSFHNYAIARSAAFVSKPAEFKVKLENYLIIENRQTRLLRALARADDQMHVVDGLWLMRS